MAVILSRQLLVLGYRRLARRIRTDDLVVRMREPGLDAGDVVYILVILVSFRFAHYLGYVCRIDLIGVTVPSNLAEVVSARLWVVGPKRCANSIARSIC